MRGKGILDEVDPAGEHRQLARTLAAEASRAWAATRITFHDKNDGTTHVEGTLPTPVASRMKTVLEAYASPRAQHAGGHRHGPAGAMGSEPAGKLPSATATPGTATPGTATSGTATSGTAASGTAAPGTARAGAGGWLAHATKLGHALCTLLEGLDPAALPHHGGAATTVVVTVNHRDLTDDLGVALLVDGDNDGAGTPISAAEARRLACNAGVLPAVLGTASQVLDLGRRARLFTSAQVTALRVRDGGCRAEGCTIPAPWCEAHHLHPWSHGGPTDLTNGILLCSHHHHLIHDPTYHQAPLPDGSIRFRLNLSDTVEPADPYPRSSSHGAAA